MAGWVAVLALLVTAVLGQNMQTWDHKYERLGQWEAANPDSVTRNTLPSHADSPPL